MEQNSPNLNILLEYSKLGAFTEIKLAKGQRYNQNKTQAKEKNGISV